MALPLLGKCLGLVTLVFLLLYSGYAFKIRDATTEQHQSCELGVSKCDERSHQLTAAQRRRPEALAAVKPRVLKSQQQPVDDDAGRERPPLFRELRRPNIKLDSDERGRARNNKVARASEERASEEPESDSNGDIDEETENDDDGVTVEIEEEGTSDTEVEEGPSQVDSEIDRDSVGSDESEELEARGEESDIEETRENAQQPEESKRPVVKHEKKLDRVRIADKVKHPPKPLIKSEKIEDDKQTSMSENDGKSPERETPPVEVKETKPANVEKIVKNEEVASEKESSQDKKLASKKKTEESSTTDNKQTPQKPLKSPTVTTEKKQTVIKGDNKVESTEASRAAVKKSNENKAKSTKPVTSTGEINANERNKKKTSEKKEAALESTKSTSVY